MAETDAQERADYRTLGEGTVKYGVPVQSSLDGPWVQWNHCDGPALHWAGNIDWLTWRERLAIFFGRKTVDEVACERWPFMERARALAARQRKEQE